MCCRRSPHVSKGVEASVAPEGASEVGCYMDKKFSDGEEIPLAPGTIAPEETWDWGTCFNPRVSFDEPQSPPIATEPASR
jgi:hypothetical protein